MAKKILFTGGGTGGHIFPIIAVAREIDTIAREQNQNIKMVFIGPAGNTGPVLKQNNIKVNNILAGKARRYFSFKNFTDIFKIFFGFIQSYVLLWWHMPDVIFSKGGYGSLTTVFVGWLFRIPIVLHESDSVPGTANKFLSKFAQKVIVSFPVQYPDLPQDKLVNIGNPVRRLWGGNPQQARQRLGIQSQKPVVFIAGGSQGALQINSLVLAVLKQLTEKYEIIHQTGPQHYQSIMNRAKAVLGQQNIASYHAAPFFEEPHIKNIFAASNLVVSRAGAGAIFEIAAAGKPSILIPLPDSAANHQEQNAYIYTSAGAAVTLTPQNVSGNLLLEQINSLMQGSQKLQSMTNMAVSFARPQAAQQVASLLLKEI